MKKKVKNYIDNEKMYNELVTYKKEYRKAKKENTILPRLSPYLGECFILIAEKLATSPKFMSYIFKEEMIGDSIENCVVYCHNFDEKKYKNPFAYFTQIIWYAFLRRIHKEKKELYIKHKVGENTMLFDPEFDETSMDDIDVDSKMFNEMFVDNDKMNDIIKNFEENLKKKKSKRKKEEKKDG